MTDFKVGDRVRLTGDIWKDDEMQMFGEVVRIDRVDGNGNAWFHYDDDEWVVDRDFYAAELVTASTYADVEDSARGYDAVIPNITPHFDHIGQDFGLVNAIVPDHYAFPGGVRVHQISGHLTSFGGQAVQYIARSTRLDGKNKGDRVENLKKAQRMINLEIERLEAE